MQLASNGFDANLKQTHSHLYSQFVHSSLVLSTQVIGAYSLCADCTGTRLLCAPTHDPKVSHVTGCTGVSYLVAANDSPATAREHLDRVRSIRVSSGPLSLMTTAHRSDPPLHCMLRNHALALKLCAPRAHHTKRIETARKAPRCHAMATDRTSQIGADRSGWHVQCPQRRSHSMWGRFHAP